MNRVLRVAERVDATGLTTQGFRSTVVAVSLVANRIETLLLGMTTE
jgi:hypothetical protein